MSENENVNIIQNAYAAFGRGDIPALLEMLSENIEWRVPGEGVIPQAGTYHGREGVARFFQLLNQSTEFLGFEPREFVAQGDRVLTLGWYRAKAIATGRTFEAQWVMSFVLRDGKVSSYQEFTDTYTIAQVYAASASATA